MAPLHRYAALLVLTVPFFAAGAFAPGSRSTETADEGATLAAGSLPAANPTAVLEPARLESATARDLEVTLDRQLFGRSGSIRSALAAPGEPVRLPLSWTTTRPARLEYRWVPVLGTPGDGAAGSVPASDRVPAPPRAGMYQLELAANGASRRFGEFHLVVTVPFDRKRNGYIGRYFIGDWPTEGARRTDRYAPPSAFVEVTRENSELQLSEHFRLREFLTKGQDDVWPKYVVVDPRLLDKLELVLAELNDEGVEARRMIVMSGFRTPQYNRRGLNQGRASLSRHQYGDAADVWVDNDGDWYMDDLNGDGRRDTGDARAMLRAVERVEARHPELIGGAGIYRDNGVHGPFIHIDVRGTPARW